MVVATDHKDIYMDYDGDRSVVHLTILFFSERIKELILGLQTAKGDNV